MLHFKAVGAFGLIKPGFLLAVYRTQVLEARGGGGGVFASPPGINVGTTMEQFGGSGSARKGEQKARSGRAEFNTKHFQKTLSLGAPAKSRAATI